MQSLVPLAAPSGPREDTGLASTAAIPVIPDFWPDRPGYPHLVPTVEIVPPLTCA